MSGRGTCLVTGENERKNGKACERQACQFHAVTGEVKKKDHEKGNSEGNKNGEQRVKRKSSENNTRSAQEEEKNGRGKKKYHSATERQ